MPRARLTIDEPGREDRRPLCQTRYTGVYDRCTRVLGVVASTSQRDAALFAQKLEQDVWVSATGGSGKPGKLVSVDSRGSDRCDQSALAARYGGPLPVEFSVNESGEQILKYATPRFAIKASLNSDSGPTWYPGQLVWLSLADRHERIWQWIARSFK